MKALGLTELRKDKIKSVMRSFQVVVDPSTGLERWKHDFYKWKQNAKGYKAIRSYFCENYNAERRLSSRLGLNMYLTRWFFLQIKCSICHRP